MQVSLNEAEVRQAVSAYIRKRLNLSSEETVTIEMVATRGSDGGCKAIIEIVEPTSDNPANAIQPQEVIRKRFVPTTTTTEPEQKTEPVMDAVAVTETPVVEVVVDAGGDVLVEQPSPVKRNALFGNLKTPT